MHVGCNVIPQNVGERRPDREVLAEELRIADQLEDLGVDSVWATEHHFSGYINSPDPLQLLTYMAGRYPRLGLGSQVVVLPWHDPLRVAEQIALLDDLSDGKLILGIGRGAARREFEGFRLDMGASREQFVEYADMIIHGLENGYCEYDGKHLKQPRVELRPRPSRSFRDRTFAAAVSPDSAPIMAKLGCGLLVIPQKPWDEVAEDFAVHGRHYREIHGQPPPPPVCGGFVYCHEDAEVARQRAFEYIGNYFLSVINHYEYGGDHFRNLQGYQNYTAWAAAIQSEGAKSFAENFVNLLPWGTPEQVLEKLVKIRKQIGYEMLSVAFKYGGMPYEIAEANIRLFAKEVLPELKKLEPLPRDDSAASAASA